MNRTVSLLVKRLGPSNAEHLTQVAGGTRLAIPSRLGGTGNHCGTLRDRVGDDLFVLLVLHFGGSRIYVPRVGTRPSIADPEAVEILSAHGWSASRIARTFGCTQRHIHKTRAKNRTKQRKEITT